jgi:GT2 family glycosyltransferase
MPDAVDVLIPTYRRPASLAVTLSGLVAQTHAPLRVVVSDQTEDEPAERQPLVESVVRILRANGTEVELLRNLPRRGLAQQRQFLLDQARAPYALFLDDDVIVEANLVERLVRAIKRAGCGFVGSALVGLSFVGDQRPHEEQIEFIDTPVEPEKVEPGGSGWDRHRLHNAANLEHLRRRLEPTGDRLYRVAWVGGCVLYDVAMLRQAGGFEFWRELPEAHAGEDVVAQLRVMERFGGCGLFPSGAYHLELPTTVPDRTVDAPLVLANSQPEEKPAADEEPVAVET